MIILKNYQPHAGQQAFHYLCNYYRFLALVSGIRGGKTVAGARQAAKDAWNSKKPGVYGIIAPTFKMLKRTTWREFKIAARFLIAEENKTDMIIKLKNGREVHGFSAEDPDSIRNATLCGFWLDEGRECRGGEDGVWKVLLGRVLSTDGRGILTTSPNGFDWIYEEFFERKDKDYCLMHFTTFENTYLRREGIEDLERKYDPKFAAQEIYGKFVVFEGQVYYTFDRRFNAGDYAFKVCQYNPHKPLGLCCDFNVDPMAWTMFQSGKNAQTGLNELYFIDEIFIRNSNTVDCCKEFKLRYPNHRAGLLLYGDASGEARHSSSNVSNYKIIQDELAAYGIRKHIPSDNPAVVDRVNAVNAMICNSKNERRLFLHPEKCKHLRSDFERVSYKEGSRQIDQSKDKMLTHPSDSAGYMIEKEFSLNKGKIEGLKI
jgi:hypothetical protein